MDQRGYTHYAASYTTRLTHLQQAHIYMMKWYKVTGATGWQKMRDRVRTAQHCQIVRRVDLHSRAGDIHV